MVCTNRRAKKGRNTGGGIAVLYKKKIKVNMKKYTFACDGCEIAVARGRLHQDFRMTFVIGLYFLPNITKRRRDAYRETLHDLLTKIKIEENDPHIIIAGDTNHCDLTDALEDFIDVDRVETPPNEELNILMNYIPTFINKLTHVTPSYL